MLLVTVSAALLAAAAVEQSNDEKLLLAAWIEWGAAHCNVSEIPALNIMFANTVIGGSDKEAVDAVRLRLLEWVKVAHHGDEASACKEFADSIRK
ncbi:hypothetical protein SAMN05421890_1580 [Ensifer adhaerens]|nr:hypothetical protein SAMN05421890_1580 [Ensifer adhaerens]